MKKLALLLAVVGLSLNGFSQQAMGYKVYNSTDTTKTQQPKVPLDKSGYDNPLSAINHYGTQLRKGHRWQISGLSLSVIGTLFILGSDNTQGTTTTTSNGTTTTTHNSSIINGTDVGYVFIGAGVISLFVGQIIVWDAAKHLRVRANPTSVSLTLDF